MFAERCHMYFPTFFICVIRILNIISIIIHTKHRPSTSNHQNIGQYITHAHPPPDPSLLSADAGLTWSLWKGSPALLDRRFRAQEGHHIVGLSMRDCKPMGIIEAPMEAIGCCRKSFGSLGDKICVQNSNKYTKIIKCAFYAFYNII